MSRHASLCRWGHYCALVLMLMCSAHQALAVNHRQELAQAQSWANSFARPYPIVVFNRDEMHYLFVQAGAAANTDEAEEMRYQIIADYVRKKVGIEISRSDQSNYETHFYITPGGAVALPLLDDKQNYKMCGVFVNAPNGNARIEVERLTGLQNKDAYEDQSYDQLTIKEDFDVMYLFSLYHEVSHCLDQEFMPSVYNSYQPDPQDIHMSESFAEVMAYFHLSKRFNEDIARARLLYRVLYSRKIGEYFAANPSLSFGETAVVQGGGVYFLAPTLGEAYLQTTLRTVRLDKMSDVELETAARDIVNDKALDIRSFSAVVAALSDRQAAQSKYEDWAFHTPDLFLQAFEKMAAYLALTDSWLKFGFDTSVQPPHAPVLKEAPGIKTTQICQAVESQNSSLFYDEIDSYRLEIRKPDYSIESQWARYEELNNLSKTIHRVCQ